MNFHHSDKEYSNFDNLCFAKVELFGHPGLLTDKWINLDTVPDDLYAYEIGRSINSDEPTFLCQSLSPVDRKLYYGTFITKDEIIYHPDVIAKINLHSEHPDMAYMCHEVVFGKDYETFFDKCVD